MGLAKNEKERERVEKHGCWYGDVVLVGKARPDKESEVKRRLDSTKDQDSVGGLWIEHV